MGVFALDCLKPPGCCYHLRSFSSPLLLLWNQQSPLAPVPALSLEKRPRRKPGNVIMEEVLVPVPPILALLRVLRRAPQEPAITLQMGLLRVLLEGDGIAGTNAAGAGSSGSSSGSRVSGGSSNCDYRCTNGGGCEVSFGGTMGSCFPRDFGGSCSGTPRQCQDCNQAINC